MHTQGELNEIFETNRLTFIVLMTKPTTFWNSYPTTLITSLTTMFSLTTMPH